MPIPTRASNPRQRQHLFAYALVLALLVDLCSSFLPFSSSFPTRCNPLVTKHECVLFSSPTRKTESSVGNTKVVYQKIVRPSSKLPDLLFLGYLVEYLQEQFQLPSDLPMPYETQDIPNEDNNDSRSILAWDSSLSPSSSVTRMEVEVVGVFTDQATPKDDQSKNAKLPRSSTPDMAIVYVKKHKSESSPSCPPMLANLFADSEKRILRALDRGLDDFVSGRFVPSSSKPSSSSQQSYESAKKAILEEFEVSDPPDFEDAEILNNVETQNEQTICSQDGIVDTIAVDVSEETDKQVPKKQLQDQGASKSSIPPQEDYAVQAARKAAEQRSKEDYAVLAAKKIMSRRRAKTNEQKATGASKKDTVSPTRPASAPTKQQQQSSADSSPLPEEQLLKMRAIKPPMTQTSRGFTISTPQQHAKRVIAKQRKRQTAQTNKERPKTTTGKEHPRADFVTKRKINLNIYDEDNGEGMSEYEKNIFSNPPQPSQRNQNKESKEPKTSTRPEPKKGAMDESRRLKQELDERQKEPKSTAKTSINDKVEPSTEEIVKAARDAMEEIAEAGKEMSPEELLEDVLKFGKEQDLENTPGRGFVSGAFEKAKELLQEQKKKREQRLQEKVVREVTKDFTDVKLDMFGPDSPEQLTPEEELRRMFEAGERIADGRITRSSTEETNLARTKEGTTEEDVDELIAADKTVSSHARVLEDELAELEVCINKSPGEEFDSPGKNPMFDIFSGPEVYNPNVDPETAVNWPGALPGTKNVRLPKELDEAVKQATFAAEVLSTMKEEDLDSENGTTAKRYTVGNRELSEHQVQNLKTVVTEAVQIGLIEDPLLLIQERSRLDMLLNELWDQPEERFREIASNFKDLLLSDNFVTLIKARLNAMADRDLDALRRDDNSLEARHARERELLGQLVVYAQLLLKETRALGAELEAQQLEVVRTICKVAMDPTHTTEEETAMALSDTVRDMRPLLDDTFVAYLKYAVAEEEGRLARAGVLDDPDHNQWLFVLKIVQQGVYKEIARGINRYIDHIWYVLRMETATERKMLLSKLIDVMPTLDVRPFVQVVENIAASLGDGVKGDFSDITELGEMTNKVLQLRRDVRELLPPERVALMSRDADEWAASQKKRLLEQREQTQQRMKAARDTAHLDGEIEALGRRGEIERMT